ncbi:hypothetical protein B9Z55_022067 [Caenorhabditis nigoni]|uniref:Uncharacterized protein n=1 Tax=Caenorhabditis nigoni TaxID=1611254 RepID=A0A2G5TV80_9PELO|nr:hypothetical protein B9Z55_022067 [Caenorhabditis nigoni]
MFCQKGVSHFNQRIVTDGCHHSGFERFRSAKSKKQRLCSRDRKARQVDFSLRLWTSWRVSDTGRQPLTKSSMVDLKKIWMEVTVKEQADVTHWTSRSDDNERPWKEMFPKDEEKSHMERRTTRIRKKRNDTTPLRDPQLRCQPEAAILQEQGRL